MTEVNAPWKPLSYKIKPLLLRSCQGNPQDFEDTGEHGEKEQSDSHLSHPLPDFSTGLSSAKVILPIPWKAPTESTL